jgi:hypothetical protein
MASLALLLAAGSMLLSVWLFKLNADRADEIQESRQALITASCVEGSRQNQTILRFLEARSEPETVAAAREFFPTPSRRECAAQTAERVDQ